MHMISAKIELHNHSRTTFFKNNPGGKGVYCLHSCAVNQLEACHRCYHIQSMKIILGTAFCLSSFLFHIVFPKFFLCYFNYHCMLSPFPFYWLCNQSFLAQQQSECIGHKYNPILPSFRREGGGQQPKTRRFSPKCLQRQLQYSPFLCSK